MEISRQTKIVCHVKNRLRSFNLLTLTKAYFETVARIKQSFLLFFSSENHFCLPEFTPCSRMKSINTIRQDLKTCMFTPPPIFHGMARVCFFLFMFHLVGAETTATTFDTTILFTKLPTGLAHYQLNCFETPLECISGQYCHGHLGKPHGYIEMAMGFRGGTLFFCLMGACVFIRVNRC